SGPPALMRWLLSDPRTSISKAFPARSYPVRLAPLGRRAGLAMAGGSEHSENSSDLAKARSPASAGQARESKL
ncbi:MAG TPA: hypothetical protein VMW42_00365, partial [Desulfatiglandales bacterium]|nr:hypothetical protein [Desulfatiglandales bacterium]